MQTNAEKFKKILKNTKSSSFFYLCCQFYVYLRTIDSKADYLLDNSTIHQIIYVPIAGQGKADHKFSNIVLKI